jgi:hypothetical protein
MAPAAGMPYDNHRDIPERLVITSSAEINGSLFTDAIVQKDCSVRVRGSVTGSLTIEPGADVLVTVLYMEKSSIEGAGSSSTTKD